MAMCNDGHNITELAADVKNLLQQLKKHDGDAWEMALGELQLPYREVAT